MIFSSQKLALPRWSLAARLVAAALVWSFAFLLVGGGLLNSIYQASLERQRDADLAAVINALAANVEARDGAVALIQAPNDSRFFETYSGRYWQLASTQAPLLGSASLWDQDLPWREAGEAAFSRPGEVLHRVVAGPEQQRLRLAFVALRIPNRAEPILFMAAADLEPAAIEADRFRQTLYAALGAAALFLLLVVVLQVRVGLAPLSALQRDIGAIRRGQADKLAGPYPAEVQALTGELNKLIDHNRQVVERARTHVGNLAHALKTPISVLLNEARAQDGPLAEIVRRQAEAMAKNVDHYLARAQAAARAETLGARAPVGPILDDLVRTLERLYGRDKDLDIEIAGECEGLVFRGEQQDLAEMAGNLLENACKYGRGRVRVACASRDAAISLMIEDDGPGLSPDRMEEALRRGARLDETAPGAGLGLAIVDELARLYGGRLALDRSPLGGLRATLSLPSAD